MNQGKWIPAEPDRASACEAAFQNGGPKVYTYEANRTSNDGWKCRAVSVSAAKAIGSLWEGQVLYSRRKAKYRYEWFKWEPKGPEPVRDDWNRVIDGIGKRRQQEHADLQAKLGNPHVFVPDADDPRFGIGYWRIQGGVMSYRHFVNGYDPLSRHEYTDEFIDLLAKLKGR